MRWSRYRAVSKAIAQYTMGMSTMGMGCTMGMETTIGIGSIADMYLKVTYRPVSSTLLKISKIQFWTR